MVKPLIASKYSILFFNCIIFVIYFSYCRLVGFTAAKVKPNIYILDYSSQSACKDTYFNMKLCYKFILKGALNKSSTQFLRSRLMNAKLRNYSFHSSYPWFIRKRGRPIFVKHILKNTYRAATVF